MNPTTLRSISPVLAPVLAPVLVAVLVAVLVGACTPSGDGTAQRDAAQASQSSEIDAASRLYVDAFAVITQRAVFASGSHEQVVARMLSDYLGNEDPYSGFMTRDEYAKYRALAKGSYGGVGMDLERRRDGDTLCYPVAGGAAERAGIKPGERLVSIDGKPVRGKPLPLIAALATGAEGTNVVLEVADAQGAARRLSVTRTRVEAPSLTVSQTGALRVVRIASFAAGTRAQVAAILQDWDAARPVVIDLRGCGGGDFYAAIDTAMLFLDKDSPIVTVSGREGERLYSSTLERKPAAHAVYLWQDNATASAAEVFIGALTGNARAVSIGTRSAGKGSRQDIIGLDDGSALILTTGYLTAPHGRAFNGTGLPPTKALAADAGTTAYVDATPLTE
jgi:carboxyl-terminal processing protease